MGLLRFNTSDRRCLTAAALERIYVCGIEEIPWLSRSYWDEDVLVIERTESESAMVFVPWCVDGHGELMLSTANLMERDAPYLLEVELARGTVNQIRNQIAAWKSVGLVVAPDIDTRVSEAISRFAKAATSQHTPDAAAEHAQATIQLAADAAVPLTDAYTAQAMSVRRRQSSGLVTLLGVNLGGTVPGGTMSQQLLSAFNAAVVPMPWRETEAEEAVRDWSVPDAQITWCEHNNLKVIGGPLLQLDNNRVPDWMYLWEDDFDNVMSFMMDYVKSALARYRGRVHIWHVAARANLGSVLGLPMHQILQIVAATVEATRQLDPRTPVVLSVDQPWAEYMARHELDLPPIGLADTLIRADLGIAGLGLEINAGYHPSGCARRGALAYSQQIDHWSLLGMPLLVSLVTPSSCEADPLAFGPARPLGDENTPLTPETQQQWVDRYIPLILSKNCVQIVIWNQLSDHVPHEFPHSGIYDARAMPKPALESLRRIRGDVLR